MPVVRILLPVAVLAAFATAGCMSPNAWDSYDSGRGLAFSALLSVLLIAGIAVLIANLATQRPPPAPQPAPPETGKGWELVEDAPEAPAATAARPAPRKAPAKTTAAKQAKPRRRAP